MDEDKISLVVFSSQLREIFDTFKKNWLLNNEARPEQWPMEMTPGEWFEQFYIFYYSDPCLDETPIPSERS